MPLSVDPELGGEEHLHHRFPLRLLRRALREQTGAQLVGLVVGVVDVVLARGEVGAALDELCSMKYNELVGGRGEEGGRDGRVRARIRAC